MAGTFYVATTGNDSNVGTIGSPFLTIAYAVSVLVAGDTLFVRGGTYTGASATIDSQGHTVHNGTSTAPITISGYPAETAIIQPAAGVSGVRLYNSGSYIVIQDLTIDMTTSATVGFADGIILAFCDHITLDGLDVKNGAGFGIHTGDAPFVEILSCQVHGFSHPGSLPGDNHGLYLSASDGLYEGNEVYNNDGYGFHIYNNSGPHTQPSRIILRKNIVYNNNVHAGSQEHGIVVGYATDYLVENNLVFNNDGGIQVYTASTDQKIYNNTIYGNTGAAISVQFVAAAPDIRNNLIFGNGQGIVDYDVPTRTYGATNVTSNPTYTNAGAGDFTIGTGSTANGAGVVIAAVPDDFAGNARPSGTYAAGAYEPGSASGVGGLGGGTVGGGGVSQTKFYLNRGLGTPQIPLFQPTAYQGGWSLTPGIGATGELTPTPGGNSNTTFSRAETNASPTFKVGILRNISGPLTAQTIAGTFDLIAAVLESDAAADFYWAIHLYVSEGDTDNVRGTLINAYAENTTNEWPTTAQGWGLQAPITMTDVDVEQGDRMVLELGYIARNSVTTSRTGTLRVGSIASGGNLADLTVGETAVTTHAPFVTFSPGITLYQPTAASGDLIASNRDLYVYDSTAGTLVRTIPVNYFSEPAGGAQDAAGNLYLADETTDSLLKYDARTLELTDTIDVSPGVLPHAVVRDTAGNLFVGFTGDAAAGAGFQSCGDFGSNALLPTAASFAIRKFDSTGSLLQAFTVDGENSGSNAIDLAADQTTMFYTSLGRKIFRFDVGANTQLPVFATLPAATAGEMARGIRVLPDGGVLVADKVNIKRLAADGSIVATYAISGQTDWGTLAMSPDGSEFWAANTANSSFSPPMIAKFNVATGAVLVTITGDANIPDTAGYLCSGGISVWNGYRAAFTPTGTGTVTGDPHIDTTAPCCPCDCPPAGTGGSGSDPTVDPPIVPTGTTGDLLDPIDPTTWVASCTGGGTVPTAVDLTDAEDWAA